MRYRFYITTTLAAGIGALMLGGCVPGVQSRSATLPLSADSVAAAASIPGTPGARWPADAWWQGWSDPQLTALIEDGLAQAPDTAVAAARLRAASAAQAARGSETRPRIDLQGDAGFAKESRNLGIPPEFVVPGWNDRGQLAASLTYDLDIWGRNRSALRAARLEKMAAALDLQQARIVLSTAIAGTYARLAEAQLAADVESQLLALAESEQRLTAQRIAASIDPGSANDEATVLVAAQRSRLVAARADVAVFRHALAALVGYGPDRTLTLDARQPDTASRALPEDATTDLLGRRADLLALRSLTEAASARIAMARADFYPSIRLEALIGLQSLGLNRLLSGPSEYGRSGAAINLPLFHRAELKARLEGAAAGYDELAARYNGAVLAAFRDLADAVSRRDSAFDRLSQAKATLIAREALAAATEQKRSRGLVSELEVLRARREVVLARKDLAVLRLETSLNDLDLIKALGGGLSAARADGSETSSNGASR